MTKAKPLPATYAIEDFDNTRARNLADDNYAGDTPHDIDPGPTGLDFEEAMKLETEQVDRIGAHLIGTYLLGTNGEERTFELVEPMPEDMTSNPYILESHTVFSDLRQAADHARRTIAALDREIEDLDRTADEQIALINARRDTNKAQREKRKEDLMKIVAADAMVNGQPQEPGA